jgi:hypothetical protein
MLSRRSLPAALLFLVVSTSAFTTAPSSKFQPATSAATGRSFSAPFVARKQVTALQERRWNFNEGSSPWGLKANAEIWNGRFAQVIIDSL